MTIIIIIYFVQNGLHCGIKGYNSCSMNVLKQDSKVVSYTASCPDYTYLKLK